ncbi:alanine racemase [Methyloceanibacter sp.]|uniref:alanine racemase n=1 Tax=Methyloceanibacter sp. TaxID=1965321 RepID=UPI002D4CDB47|nr:alanine racemase [Methyloceanibacter sp.]HZP10322.1 alanine racemase [Methyloceanibacter sp.]
MTNARTAPAPSRDEGEDAGETAILTIDLDALAANYQHLSELARPAECAAVVKADAYGLGMAEVAPVLWRQGCKTFFVATPAEAEALRRLLPQAVIYVLAGLMPGTAGIFRRHGLRPVLNSAEEIREWANYAMTAGEALPCAVHIDSGMNRLGLSAAEVEAIAAARDVWGAFTLSLVMSHLACADEPDHPKNETQRRLFDALRARLPKAPASLANSPGMLLGHSYLYDLVRPGIALYGGTPQKSCRHSFAPVVHLKGRILQARTAGPGETVGYGATRTLARPSRIATVSVGYADGFFRSLSSKEGMTGFTAYAGNHAAPILGRVSMDLITIDVTDVPEALSARGGWVELIGPHVSAEMLAHHAGTIDYEVLTNLGARALRRYIGG